MTLRELAPNRLVTYRSTQTPLPDADHERHFRPVDGGFSYRIVVEYEPRRGRSTRPSFVAASTAPYGGRCST